ncbi:LPS export ABC transporter periplasmic protein LptC [Shewanella sp. MBTL60-007]|uniref:LPS export ABC transporter periplasmic protein LptC n=1 Tax=Shewanella sp. MBTL60-007 TaxID=2815911 RepID=UPI001BBC8575|nr:LPS export ABC transporter periplasmic protein LptC [Shewanella sp. MBTL60-007]GIU22703.1 lipopolysaccharide export system protein LptC [Shewanella sp. MBTL60-007]
MNRVTLAIIAFFGTALLLYWQVQSKKSEQELDIDMSQRPDYIIDDLRSIEYNELGLINSEVSAKHMEHFDSVNMTYFTEPVYLIYPDDGQAQWRLRSEKGSLNKATGKVALENNVIIDSISPEEPIQTLSTSYLELDLNTMIMTSDETIHVTGNEFVIQGLGLYADLNAQSVKLVSQVEGIYEAK